MLAEGEDVCTRAAAEIQRPACIVSLEESDQFRRGDSAVPGRFLEIHHAEEQPAAEFMNPMEHGGILPDALIVGG